MTQLSLFPDDPRPLAGCVSEPWHAWRRFQSAARRMLETSRARHGRSREIIRQRTDTVHRALGWRGRG